MYSGSEGPTRVADSTVSGLMGSRGWVRPDQEEIEVIVPKAQLLDSILALPASTAAQQLVNKARCYS